MFLPYCFEVGSNYFLIGRTLDTYTFINCFLEDHFAEYAVVMGINLKAEIDAFGNHLYKNYHKMVSDLGNFVNSRQDKRILILIETTNMETPNVWLELLLNSFVGTRTDLIVVSETTIGLKTNVRLGFKTIMYQPYNRQQDLTAFKNYFEFMGDYQSFMGELHMVVPNDFLVYHNHPLGGDSWFYFSNPVTIDPDITDLVIEV